MAVRYLTRSNIVTSDPANIPRLGLIELSVIGLSSDNPSVFDRRVAYLQGNAKSPLASVMRTVTNWDFVNKRVPEGRTGDSGGTTLQLMRIRRFIWWQSGI